MKEYQKPLKRKGLALFPKGKGKTARIRERNRRGETALFLNGKEEKGCAYANAPSAAISSYKSVIGSPLDCRYAAVKGTPAAEEGYTPKPWFT